MQQGNNLGTCAIHADEAARLFLASQAEQRFQRWLASEGVRRAVITLQSAGAHVVLVLGAHRRSEEVLAVVRQDRSVDVKRLEHVRAADADSEEVALLRAARSNQCTFVSNMAIPTQEQAPEQLPVVQWAESMNVPRELQARYDFDANGVMHLEFPQRVDIKLLDCKFEQIAGARARELEALQATQSSSSSASFLKKPQSQEASLVLSEAGLARPISGGEAFLRSHKVRVPER
mmetsp:Transcript_142147/g.247726  ORF Transcript_142147/g.247726 Transcript_142147/m.247726 type:complete len:233 (-) Transcript_142147:52-750(-)